MKRKRKKVPPLYTGALEALLKWFFFVAVVGTGTFIGVLNQQVLAVMIGTLVVIGGYGHLFAIYFAAALDLKSGGCERDVAQLLSGNLKARRRSLRNSRDSQCLRKIPPPPIRISIIECAS